MSTTIEHKLEYKTVILARLGEIALKGLNKRAFINKVVSNLAWRVKRIANYKVYLNQSRVWVEAQDEEAAKVQNLEDALKISCRVFGIVSASLVIKFAGSFAEMEAGAEILVKEQLAKHKTPKTFRVEARRANKSFPLNSIELSAKLGASILRKHPELSVDLHEPDFCIYVEIRDEISMYVDKHEGLRGLPVGSSSKGLLLLSGGIDSPVAGFQMASRGMEIEAIYFHTFPFTSDEAKEKVISLARILSEFTGRIKLHIVDFTDIQINLKKNVPGDMMTVVMRRMMYRIAERVARQRKCKAMITGESLGQVASQTAEALMCTDKVCNMPVYRPLIGMDKDWTVNLSRFIGTYETSILPYEDCCTVFVSRHPKTRPSLEEAEAAESKLNIEALVAEGLDKIDTLIVSNHEDNSNEIAEESEAE